MAGSCDEDLAVPAGSLLDLDVDHTRRRDASREAPAEGSAVGVLVSCTEKAAREADRLRIAGALDR